MYSYIIGEFVEMTPEGIVIENNGIGYDIKTSSLTAENIPKSGEFVKVYTYLHVREDDMSLYGFLHRQDREMFQQLLGVNGVGPKGALGILSALRPDDLRMAIISGDAKAISRAPGIGTKTAQRVILDLKDKVSPEDLFSSLEEGLDPAGASLPADVRGDAAKEAIQALVALGYSNLEAARAVRKTEVTEDMTAEDVLKASLRHLSFL